MKKVVISSDSVAVQNFKRDGYVVLEERLASDVLGDLYREFMTDFEKKRARYNILNPFISKENIKENGGQGQGGNHDRNRWNMRLRSALPFLDSRVIANPSLMRLAKQFLDDSMYLATIASDINMPFSLNQVVHRDALRLFLSVNIPLVDVTVENGPTEVWHGTQVEPGQDFHTGEVSDKAQPDFSKIESTLMTVPAGSIIIRDARTYHRGTPNRSKQPRPMLTLLYFDKAGLNPAVPYPWITTAADHGIRAIRKWSLPGAASSPLKGELLGTGNIWGRIVMHSAKTDRLGVRAIPLKLWRDLPSETKSLLRYAHVERNGNDQLREQRSLDSSARFVRMVSRGGWITMKRCARAMYRPPQELKEATNDAFRHSS